MKKALFILVAVLSVLMMLSFSVSAEEPSVDTYGVKITVNGLDDVRDFFIAKGEFDSYKEIKTNGYIVRVTENKIADKYSYTYTVSSSGMHTVLVRYKDGREYVFHKELTVDEPEFITNGLQVTVGNIPDVKVIRTAYGEYSTPGETKRVEGSRSYSSKADIKGQESYKLQYRKEGTVTIAVEYNNGYIKVFHYNVQKKTPAVEQQGNTVSFGNLDGLVMIRYAMGEYSSSSEIKAAGGKVIKPDSIVDGKITVSDLENGIYTFSVQYDDESYNYYTIKIENLPGRIVCWGDSLTHSVLTGFKDLVEFSYPRRLSQLSGMEVKNYGIGAERAEHIARRQGGLVLGVKPVTIPATTTPVAIELVSDLKGTSAGVARWGLAGINPVIIGGVEGQISRNGNTVYFTRSEAGEAVTVKGISTVYTFAMLDKRDNDIMVVWAGHNNDYVNGQGHMLIDTIDKMIKYHGSDRYVVVGMTAERRAPAYKDINAALKEHYGDKFVDAQPYLADPARLTELGITPTAKDLEYLSKGWTPPSLLAADDLHLNQEGYDIIAELVYEKIVELGYPLYPIDKTNKQYTLTLDMGDGNKLEYGINTGDHYYDVIPECPIPEREGYRFLGWTNEYGNTLSFIEYVHDTYTYRCDTTFTAKWEKKADEVYYSINFDPAGGVMDEGCATSYPIRNGEYYYQAIQKYPTATKEGYTFGGWYIAEYGYTLTPQSFYYDYYAIFKDCTFTAIWNKN